MHDHHGYPHGGDHEHGGRPPHDGGGGRPPHDGGPPHDGNRPPDGGDRQPWQHDTEHRRAVPYRNDVINRQFGRTSLPNTDQFRGHAQPVQPASPQEFPAPQQRIYVPGNLGSGRTLPPAGTTSPPAGGAPPPVFEGIGRGPDVRGYSARGATSLPNAMPRSAPPRAPAPPRPAPRPAPSHGH